MPVVLRVGALRVAILLPPREHHPPHVHVRNSDGEVVIELASSLGPQRIRSVDGMRTPDVATALWIVRNHTQYLLARWREFHG